MPFDTIVRSTNDLLTRSPTVSPGRSCMSKGRRTSRNVSPSACSWRREPSGFAMLFGASRRNVVEARGGSSSFTVEICPVASGICVRILHVSFRKQFTCEIVACQ
jgi:hypothetical protein